MSPCIYLFRSKLSSTLDKQGDNGDGDDDDDNEDDDDDDMDKSKHFAELRRLNDQMIQVERAFIYSYGLPGRQLVRHVAFAPSQYNLYGSSSFPGISDVLFNVNKTGEWEEVERQISIAAQAVLSAVDVLTPYDEN